MQGTPSRGPIVSRRHFRQLAGLGLTLSGLALVVGTAAMPALADGAVQIVEADASDVNSWGFDPPTVTISAGQLVTWINTGTLAHTATATSGQFDTGLIQPGESKSLPLSSAGSYDYQCTPHPWMKGSLVVQAAGAAPAAAPAAAPNPAPGAAPNAAPAAAPVAQLQPTPTPVRLPTPTPFRFGTTATTTTTTTTTPPPRAGGIPLELALPMLAGGASAVSGGVYLLRRGRRRP